MNRGLMSKTLRETWLTTLLLAMAFAAVEILLTYVLLIFHKELSGQWLQLGFVQSLLKGLVGTEIGTEIGWEAIAGVPWVHPIVLALLWTHGIVFCTRVPAGEVDRGTIDVLLSLPASRTRVYLCETAVWLASGLTVIVIGSLGNFAANRLFMPDPKAVSIQSIIITVNLYCLYIAVGGAACLVSSLSDRRGRAVAVVFAIVLASFFLNFVAQFWEPASSVSFLGVLNYYRPVLVLRDAAWPVRDLLVLALAGATLWAVGAIIFAHRDIRTV